MQAQTIVSKLAKLLENFKYSDLVLKCEGESIAVHRAIVCPQSSVIAAACDGNFDEAKSGTLEVSIADVPTLRRMLTYLYTGDYDDSTQQYTASEHDLPLADLDIDSAPHKESDAECSHCDTHSHAMNLNNERLIANVNTFIIADYYNIPELMQLAIDKFKIASRQFQQKGFADVLSSVYGSTPESARELRATVCSIVASNVINLVADEEFMEAAAHAPSFIKDIFLSLIMAYASRVRDGEKNVKHLIAEHATVQQELQQCQTSLKTAQDATQKVRTDVNNAKRCRHCGLESNIYFEHELHQSYTLRCVCRTRYQ